MFISKQTVFIHAHHIYKTLPKRKCDNFRKHFIAMIFPILQHETFILKT